MKYLLIKHFTLCTFLNEDEIINRLDTALAKRRVGPGIIANISRVQHYSQLTKEGFKIPWRLGSARSYSTLVEGAIDNIENGQIEVHVTVQPDIMGKANVIIFFILSLVLLVLILKDDNGNLITTLLPFFFFLIPYCITFFFLMHDTKKVKAFLKEVLNAEEQQ